MGLFDRLSILKMNIIAYKDIQLILLELSVNQIQDNLIL